MKRVKATDQEKSQYKGVYPLHHWLVISDEFKIAVEDLRCWSRPDPQWEAVLPKGYVFDYMDTHTLLGVTQADLLDRVKSYHIVKCEGTEFCSCAVDKGD